MGPSKADILAKEFDILTYGDLLHYFPFRMVDRSRVSTIDHYDPNEPYLVFRGRIGNLHTITSGRTSRLEATFSDGTGSMTLVWFQGLKWIKEMLRPNTIYNVMGKQVASGYSNGTIPVSELGKGVYMLCVEVDKCMETIKFVVK